MPKKKLSKNIPTEFVLQKCWKFIRILSAVLKNPKNKIFFRFYFFGLIFYWAFFEFFLKKGRRIKPYDLEPDQVLRSHLLMRFEMRDNHLQNRMLWIIAITTNTRNSVIRVWEVVAILPLWICSAIILTNSGCIYLSSFPWI